MALPKGIDFVFFFNWNGVKGYKGGSFPLLSQMEERMRDPMGMLPNTRWVEAHLAKKCAWKLAHLETFKTLQLWKKERSRVMSDTIEANCQIEKRWDWFITRITRGASPSKVKQVKQP